jgi:malonyl-CoA decarboxylase
LLSERGEASQTVLAQEWISDYEAFDEQQRLQFFQVLCREFGPDEVQLSRAAAAYQRSPNFANYQELAASLESPWHFFRQLSR